MDAWPVLFIGLTVLVWLLDGTGARGGRGVALAALTGWLFGFGYFLAGLFWIGSAFLVEAETFGWLMPFAVLLLPAGLALFTALGTGAAWLLWSPGPWRIAALALGLAGADWLRGHLFTGFPWIAFGQAMGGWLPFAQAGAYIGLYGLSLLAVAIFASPAALAGAGGRARAVPGALAASALIVLALAGLDRLGSEPPPPEETVRLRIVQPAIDQRNKWRPELYNEVLAEYLALSERGPTGDSPGLDQIDLVVWPETALPIIINQTPDAFAAFAALLPEGTALALGAVRAETTAEGERRFFNSLYAVDDSGTPLARYDKTHLVPFGEYLPFRAALEAIGLEQLTRLHGGFAAGRGREPLTLSGLPPVGALICYEIIFPGAAVPPGERPAWLLNVTNDAWFGTTSGPYQHFAQARMRAIEEGLPLVRAANTGISAVIDGHGRVLARLGLARSGALDATLPAPLPTTWYSRHGGASLLVLFALALAGALMGRLHKRGMDI